MKLLKVTNIEKEVFQVEEEGGELIISIEYETNQSQDGGHTFERETASFTLEPEWAEALFHLLRELNS